jgi:ectoine hydroxylase-related dioxygenase (phytanoyl-CoA dioxygenase family)
MLSVVSLDTSSAMKDTNLKMHDDHARPLPQVRIFDAATANVDDLVAAIIEAGGCVIRKTTSPSNLAEIEKATRHYLQNDGDWSGDFFPKETKRVMGLIGKSPTYIEHVVQNRFALAVADRFLTSTYKCWVGNELKTFVSKPQLNNTITFSIAPGARDQELHRDDMIHHNPVKCRTPAEYKFGDDTGVGFFIAGKKSTRENGATRFIPGSHLWDQLTPPQEDLAFYAELEPGDAFIFLSSCFHGGSANKTIDQERLMYSCFFTKGFLRQEENQYLAADFDTLSTTYDDQTLELIGYNLSPPFMGWVDIKHPLDYLRGNVGMTDLY